MVGVLALTTLAPIGCAHRAPQGRSEMMQAMEQRQAKLDELVAKMNAAEGEAKVDAIAAVVDEMVAQHKMMHEQMRKRHAEMHPQ
jgi:hypothetical protein